MQRIQQVICLLPVQNGVRFNETAWGLCKIAKQAADKWAARLIGVAVHIGVAEHELSSLPFDEVYHVKLDEESWHTVDKHIEAYEAVLNQLNNSSGLYLFSSNPLYHESAVRLSMLRRGAIVTNAAEIRCSEEQDSACLVKRSIFHGKIDEWVSFNEETTHRFVTFDQAILYGKPVLGRADRVEEITVRQNVSGSISYEGEIMLSLAELKISEARCVIGIGRGVHGCGASDLGSILKLAELLNAPIGGSKVADELGLIPREKRIGSSGHSIEADIYIAIGISGSTQHLAGITGVKHVVAINRDAAAPIFNRCEIGIVGDFREAVRLLTDAIESERQRDEHAQHQRTG
jgi:electron transfer flavoprotein alpha subunit